MDLKINKQLMKINKQLMMNEPTWWCGTRIRTGAIAASIIGAICSAIMAAGFLIIGFTHMNISHSKEVRCIAFTGSSLHVISIFLYISVIVMYTAKKDNAWAYLPYLIIQGLVLVLHVILNVLTNCLNMILCIHYAKVVATFDIRHPNDGTDARALSNRKKVTKLNPKVNMQLMMNEPRCCCRTRIRTGALVMAIIGVIYYAIAAICAISLHFISFKTKDVAYIKCVLACVVWIVSLLNFISYLLFIVVMYAARKDKARVYLPYLIIQGIGFILSVIYCIFVATAKFDKWHSNDKTPSKAGVISYMIIIIAFLLFTIVLEIYLYSVIWRAYKFTKDFVEPNHFGQVQQVGLSTGNTVTLDAPKCCKDAVIP